MKKRIFSGKIVGVCVFALLLILLCVITAYAIYVYSGYEAYYPKYMFLEGEYSVDGGDWKPIDPEQKITEHFRKIEFRGKPVDRALNSDTLTIFSKNVWYRWEAEDGTLLSSYEYVSTEQELAWITEVDPDLFTPEMLEEYTREMERYKPLMKDQKDTPGYKTREIILSALEMEAYEDMTLHLTVWTPYSLLNESFSDCFSITFSERNGAFIQFYAEAFPAILFALIVGMFGLFFFPIAGFILGRVDFKYLAFGGLCFFWGLNLILETMSGFLNLWILDSVVVMLLVKVTWYFFLISLLLYLRSYLKQDWNRIMSGSVCLVYSLTVSTVIVLQVAGVADLIRLALPLNVVTAFALLFHLFLLAREFTGTEKSYGWLVSWTPLVVTILMDVFCLVFRLNIQGFFKYGIALTMIYQVVRLVGDLRMQYQEAIRYQKMQKELYEAEVAVMVSQIRPHFMYNALSSIAMLCKLNPDTAYDATIAFSEYLRGNMDSLNQKEPVPFEKELEHLKKYLFIEQLRFGKKLNVEYDIGITDFVVPQLSVQPLVENAVKHGVGQKKKGGTVRIATRETENGYEVVVTDDGVGFDVNAPKKEDGRSHVGMDNTRRRLKEMIGAEVVIESTVGEGTTARIVIPRRADMSS